MVNVTGARVCISSQAVHCIKIIEGQREMAVEQTTECLSLSKQGQRDRYNPIRAPKPNNALSHLSSLRQSTHLASFWNPREKVKHSRVDK